MTRKMSGMHKVLDSSDQNFGVGYLVKVVGAGSCPALVGHSQPNAKTTPCSGVVLTNVIETSDSRVRPASQASVNLYGGVLLT